MKESLGPSHIQIVSLRMVREKPVRYGAITVGKSAEAYELFRKLIQEQDRESFWIACLDPKLKLSCISQISLGSLTESSVHPREVFKVALLANAHAIIAAHNHPSGDATPSLDDMLVTERLQRSGELLGIELKDHVIIGESTYYSFADEGKL